MSRHGWSAIWPQLALTLAALFWSGNFIAGRALAGRIEPLELNILRWVICLALLLPVTAPRLARHRRELARAWRLIALLGLTGIAAFHIMVYEALRHTSAVNALLILALAPIATAAGGAIWDGFRPSRRQLQGFAVSLIGAAILILRGSGESLGTVDPGKVWMTAAVLVWAVYSLLLRRRPPELPQDVTLAGSVAAGLVVMLALAMFTGLRPIAVSPGLVAAVLYIAVFASLAGFLLWSQGVSGIGPERAGQFIHLMPLFGTVLAILLLGERPTLAQGLGAVCVVAGIVLVNRGRTGSDAARA